MILLRRRRLQVPGSVANTLAPVAIIIYDAWRPSRHEIIQNLGAARPSLGWESVLYQHERLHVTSYLVSKKKYWVREFLD